MSNLKSEIDRIIELYDSLINIHDYIKTVLPDRNIPDDGDFAICCPLHDEEEPSFKYRQSSNSWACFGACHTTGRVVRLHYLLMNRRYGNIGIVKALIDLQKLFPTILPVPSFTQKSDREESIENKLKQLKKARDIKRPVRLVKKDIKLSDYILMEFTRNNDREEIKWGDS